MKPNNINVQVVYNTGLCTQCGTCAALCPHSSIHLDWDGKSGYVLSVDKDSCNDCGLCYEVCPGHEVDFEQLNDRFLSDGLKNRRVGRYISTYTGHAIQEKLRWDAASGGIVTALLVAALKMGEIDGAIVTRMNPDSPLEPQTIIATTEEQIIEARGSKYCPVAANLNLREVLSSAGRYAFVGLPCHIHGLRKAQTKYPRLRKKVAFCISIFCGLNMSPLGTRVMLRRYGISVEDVRQIRYRGNGWPGGLRVEFQDQETQFIPYREYFDDHFRSYEMHRCNLCSDTFGELADISCGDAWLNEFTNSDDQGTSVVIVRSQIGKEFLSSLNPGILALSALSIDKTEQSQRKALRWKKDLMAAKIALTRLIGKATPVYQQKLPPPLLNSYSFWTRTVFSRYVRRVWHRLRGHLRNRRTDESY